MKNKTVLPNPSLPTPISADEAYSLEDLRHLGLGASAVRQARRKGLPFAKIGQRKYVRGAALLAYMERTESTEP